MKQSNQKLFLLVFITFTLFAVPGSSWAADSIKPHIRVKTKKSVKFLNDEKGASGSPVTGHVEFHKRESVDKLYHPVKTISRLTDKAHSLVKTKKGSKDIQRAKLEHDQNMASTDPSKRETNYKVDQPLPVANQGKYSRRNRKERADSANAADRAADEKAAKDAAAGTSQ